MMASGGVEKGWQQIEEEITCSICGDLFTDPKTIPCLHTFCKKCIEKSIESNKKMAVIVCCPLCRVALPRDGMASIPTNFRVNRLVEIFTKRQNSGETSVETKCGNCEESLPAVTWCMQCEDPLCHNCNEIHKKVKAYKSHKTVPIKEFFQTPKQALSRTEEKLELCKEQNHTNQPLDLYCRNCSKLICQYCTLKDHPRGHRDHDFDFVDEVVDEEKEKIKQVTAPLKQLLERVRNGVDKIERCEKQFDIQSAANVKRIQATYGEVYKLLKQQEEETVEKVNTIKTSFKKKLFLQKENGKSIENQLVSCDEFCENIVTGNRTRQVLMYSTWIRSRVEELTKQVKCASLDPECKPSDMVVNYHSPVKFVNGSVCDVLSVPHLPDCTVSGLVVRYSGRVKVTITLKDIFGYPVLNQSKDLEIRCNKEKEFLQNRHIEEESRGQYHIWYNPKRKEDHLLSVYWRGLALGQKVSVNMLSELEVKKTSIRLRKKLGAGQFSEVWEGIWKNTTPVAVRALKPDTSEFLEQAVLMKQLRHPKLIQLYAVCTRQEPIYIITELMKHGSLLEYLRGDGRSLKLPQLIDMGAQVAAGMAYLEEKDYIHRDLAARNILVSVHDGNLICKLDVGVIDEDIYEAPTGTKFPIKWTAPEAAMCNLLTIKSDVWSFGILLYELITYGRFPYPGMNNAQVLEALQTGYRMPCPMGCPEQFYEIMRECWRDDAASRPAFETLQWKLEGFSTRRESIWGYRQNGIVYYLD